MPALVKSTKCDLYNLLPLSLLHHFQRGIASHINVYINYISNLKILYADINFTYNHLHKNNEVWQVR
jgi:hypothetical protein